MGLSSRLLIVSLVTALAGVDALAQTYQGGVRGAVRDQMGVIPGAVVTLTHEGTNAERRTATNAVGQYVFANLAPGVYALTSSVDGFKPYLQTGIEIGVQRFVVIDIPLELGSIEETVMVLEESPVLDNADASRSASLHADEMVTLPTTSRNPFYLLTTTPNVVFSGNPQFTRMQDQNSTSLLSIGGGPRRGNNYTLDGVPITDMLNRAVIIPSMESIEEVKVQVSTYDAEMGRTGGGVFNTVHKRGTNQWHGSGLIQNRPQWGQSQLFFEKEAGDPKADTYYWLYGGSFGGPIIPDKTFFWAGTEGYRTNLTRNRILTLPTAAMARGDFSGSGRTIYDPLTTRPDPNHPGRFLRDPFPGNIIPPDRLNPVGLRIASFLAAQGAGDVSASANVVDAADQFTLNLTHQLNQQFTLTGTYMYYDSSEPSPLFIGGPYDGNNGELFRRVHLLSLNNTFVPSESSVVTFRYGYFSFDDDFTLPEFDVAGLGFSENFQSQVQRDIFPVISLDDYPGGGSFGPEDVHHYSHSVNATWSKFFGKHTLKVGGDYRRLGVDQFFGGASAGFFRFTQGFTRGPDTTDPMAGTGDALASLLLGFPNVGLIEIARPQQLFIDYVGGFVHDDWRLSESVVLNLGLRIEHEEGRKEKNDRQTVGFDREAPWPIQPVEGMTLKGGLLYAGVDGAPRHLGDPALVKLGPRVGTAWSINSNTVLRGGVGQFWAPYQESFAVANGFSAATFYLASTDGGLTPAGTLTDPFPNGLVQPSGSSLGLVFGAGDQVSFADQFQKSAYVQQYSMDLQRELPGEVVVSAGYLGSRSERLGMGGANYAPVNINQLDPSLQALGPDLLEPVPNPFFGNPIIGNLSESETIPLGQLLRPYPQFGDLLALQVSEGRRRYHSVVVKLEKGYRRGWSARINYTFSRTDDNVFGEANFFSGRPNGALDNTHLDGEYARSITDTPHRLNISGIYELPFGKGRRWLQGNGLWNALAGGWTVSAVGFYHSGFPIAILQVPNNGGVFSNLQRPDVVPGVDPGHTGSTIDNLDSYLNPDAWVRTEAFTFGRAPRTDTRVRTPFRKNWDVAFQKSHQVGGVRGTFRLEIINVFDTPDFDGPENVFGIRSFGKIQGVNGFPRTLQFMLRVDW